MKEGRQMKNFLFIWLAVMVIDNLLPFALAKYYKGYDHKKMILVFCYLPFLWLIISELLKYRN